MAIAASSPHAPRALITRPEPEASQWVHALAAQGLQADAFPLICIGPAPDAHRLQEAQRHVLDYRALMFVSGNAARSFFDENTAAAFIQHAQRAINSRASVRVWSPGPGTARTLRSLGVPAAWLDQPAADAAQFDSESLWQQVGSSLQPGDRVLIVRGSDSAGHYPTDALAAFSEGAGREWLSAQIRLAGGSVDYVAAYTRTAPVWTPEALARARSAARDGSPWVLSSAQALRHLTTALPAHHWEHACAVTTHPRIADAARAAGFGTVLECRPSLIDVSARLASIESGA